MRCREHITQAHHIVARTIADNPSIELPHLGEAISYRKLNRH